MVRILSGLAAAGLLLAMPQSASAQFGGGGFGGIGGQQQMGLTYNPQLGPPPAGVFLHQQYMQLYGLPVNFQAGNQQMFNNNQAGGGGYPGGGFPGGYPGFNGVNYQRQLAAMRMQAAYYNAAAAYNNYNNNNNQRPASFGTGSLSNYQPSFATQSSPGLSNTSTGFSGFGLNTANPFVASDPAKKDETKKDETKKDDAK